jgi:hypothetical protein
MVEKKAPAADGGRYKGKSDPRGRGEPRPYKKSKENPKAAPKTIHQLTSTIPR